MTRKLEKDSVFNTCICTPNPSPTFEVVLLWNMDLGIKYRILYHVQWTWSVCSRATAMLCCYVLELRFFKAQGDCVRACGEVHQMQNVGS